MGWRKYARKPPHLRYRGVFLIATEGHRTEPIYFQMFSYER